MNCKVLKTFGKEFNEAYTAAGGAWGGNSFGFTTAAFIDGILGRLFGVVYRGENDSVLIASKISEHLYWKTVQLSDLILPTGSDIRLSIRLTQSAAAVHAC
jgi:hypothetical protein